VLVVLVVVVVVVVVVVMAVLCCYNTVTDLTITGSAVAVLCDIRHDVRHRHQHLLTVQSLLLVFNASNRRDC
jgi:hypothetical protein